jgi:hypothetical protein
MKKKKTERRYRITSDDVGHEYFLKVGMEGEFELWLAAEAGRNDEPYTGHDYNGNRIDGCFTFTDPKCE